MSNLRRTLGGIAAFPLTVSVGALTGPHMVAPARSVTGAVSGHCFGGNSLA